MQLVGPMVELEASVDIPSRPEAVWAVLTDFSRFSEWNPFIRQASGIARVGADIGVRVRTSRGVPLVFHAKVTLCKVNRELCWSGHVLAPWFAKGEHTFTLEPTGHGVRFRQREVFTGVFPSLARSLLVRETRKGFESMNEALKARAQSARSAPSCG